MCGRFYVDPGEPEIYPFFRALDDQHVLPGLPEELLSGEKAPTTAALVLSGEELEPMVMQWGFPGWSGPRVIFNARAETALDKAMFRKALVQWRVAVPVSGFYEWKAVEGQKKKDKYLFTLPEGGVLYLAAFADWRVGVEGQGRTGFAS